MTMVCEHLKPLKEELDKKTIKITFEGKPWSENCRHWIYYDCFLDTESIKSRFNLNESVITHTNDDIKSGMEHGLYCEKCHDAIMGFHPSLAKNKRTIS